MIPYKQPTNDTCFPTAIACILEVDPAEVPNFCWIPGRESEDYILIVNEWLAPRGLAYLEVRFAEDGSKVADALGLHVISGPGPRGFDHSVVGFAGRILHDPFPEGGDLLGTLKDWTIGVFVPINPVNGAPHDKRRRAPARKATDGTPQRRAARLRRKS